MKMMNLQEIAGVKTTFMENYNEEKYKRAKKRVKQVKDFYTHLTVYLVVNILLILMHIGIFQNGILNLDYATLSMFITPFFWGIGLLFHGLYVFQYKLKFFREWEERKLKEFMDQEDDEMKRENNWD